MSENQSTETVAPKKGGKQPKEKTAYEILQLCAKYAVVLKKLEEATERKEKYIKAVKELESDKKHLFAEISNSDQFKALYPNHVRVN